MFTGSVREIFNQYPEAVLLFIRLKTQCIGCAFDRFCTLEDISQHYNIQIDDLKDLLQREISKTQ